MLPVIIIQGIGADEGAFRDGDAPFVAIGKVEGFANGIISDDIEDKVLRAGVGDLVRFVGSEDKGVAGFDRGGAVFVTDGSGAGDNMIEFPLGAVRMVRVGGFAGRDAADLHVKGMAFVEVGGLRFASQLLGDFFAGPGEFAFGRGPGDFFDFIGR